MRGQPTGGDRLGTRLGRALGGKAETFAGLAGLGDLALTCGSASSRNFSLGLALAEGKSLADGLAGLAGVSEGASSAAATVALARRAGVEMPIAEAVAEVVAARLSIAEAIGRLLSRPLKREGT